MNNGLTYIENIDPVAGENFGYSSSNPWVVLSGNSDQQYLAQRFVRRRKKTRYSNAGQG